MDFHYVLENFFNLPTKPANRSYAFLTFRMVSVRLLAYDLCTSPKPLACSIKIHARWGDAGAVCLLRPPINSIKFAYEFVKLFRPIYYATASQPQNQNTESEGEGTSLLNHKGNSGSDQEFLTPCSSRQEKRLLGTIYLPLGSIMFLAVCSKTVFLKVSPKIIC